MSLDSPYEQLERYIAYGSGIYFIIIFWIIFLQVNLPGNVPNGPSAIGPANIPEPQTFKNDLPTDLLTVASLTTLSFVIGYYIKYLGIHRFIDSHLFHFERKVNDYICDELRGYFNRKFPILLGKYRKPTNIELMYIFYEFVNKQQDSWVIQRALSFSYWLKYRLSMNLIALSIVGITANFIFTYHLGIPNGTFENYFYLPYIFFTIVGVVAWLVSQKKVRRDIFQWTTKPQLVRIVHDSEEELHTMFEKRFRL
jgi:hypothetical protein